MTVWTSSLRRPRRQVAVLVGLALLLSLTVASTFSAFTASTASGGNTVAATSVTLTDNDSGAALLSLTNATPGASDTGCIQVTYSGTPSALVRLYGTTTGTGLDPYLDLTVTRGTISSGSFDSCTNFTADATNYLGQGNGVIYQGTVAGFADDHAAGILDPRPASAETWTTGETHAYKLTVTLQDNVAAEGLSATQSFTWEARGLSVYQAAVLADNPAGYWRLGESAGATATATSGSPNGTYTNTPTLGVAGGVNDTSTAVAFDGGNQHVTLGDVYDFAGTSAFSVEFWLRPTSANNSNWRAPVEKHSASGGDREGWSIWLSPETDADPNWRNRIGFERWTGATKDSAYNTDPTDTMLQVGTWYHVVCTYDGATLRVYVNGTLEASQASSRSLANHASPLVFATSNALGTWGSLGGTLDEVAIYTSALSPARVKAHYDAGR